MEVRNPVFTEGGNIDCEVNHSQFGWIPYTASEGDASEIYAAALAMGPAPYTPPPPPDAPTIEEERKAMVASRFQAKAALIQAGLMAQAETAVASADPVIQLAWAEANVFERNSPAIAALGAAIGLTETELDDLFRAAMQIKA